MKLLILLTDMVRADRIQSYNSSLAQATPLDSFISSFGGTCFTNAYTVAPDSSRSCAALFTSHYPKENGITHRFLWPRESINPQLPTMVSLFEEHAYRSIHYVGYGLPAARIIPSLQPHHSLHLGTFDAYTKELAQAITQEENLISYCALDDYHWAIDDLGAHLASEHVAQTVTKEALDLLFSRIDKDAFDYIVILSDHGMKMDHEAGKAPELDINDNRSRIFMLLRKRGESDVMQDTRLCSVLDIMPTLVEASPHLSTDLLKQMKGSSLLSTPTNTPLIIEDWKLQTIYSLHHKPEVWAVRTRDHFYLRSRKTETLLHVSYPNNTPLYTPGSVHQEADLVASFQALIERTASHPPSLSTKTTYQPAYTTGKQRKLGSNAPLLLKILRKTKQTIKKICLSWSR